MKPAGTEMMYRQLMARRSGSGYPGLAKCPSGSLNKPSLQDTDEQKEVRR